MRVPPEEHNASGGFLYRENQSITRATQRLWRLSSLLKVLGYSNPHKAIGDHYRYLAKREVPHPQSADKTIEMSFIPEGDLYRLIARSKLPAA